MYVQLYGVACDHYPVMIVMEFCPGGNLQDHLQKYKDQIEVPELVAYASEVRSLTFTLRLENRLCTDSQSARGMRYLHSKSCVHRDLAARNCLISDTGLIKVKNVLILLTNI